MATIAFDAFKYMQILEKGGYTHEQAEAHATAQKEAIAEAFQVIATKEEVIIFKSELKGDLKQLESSLELKMESTKVELMKWYIGIAVFQTITFLSGIVAMAKLLHN